MTPGQAVGLMVLPAVHMPAQVGHHYISSLYYSFLLVYINDGGRKQTGVQTFSRLGLPRRSMARVLCYMGISGETPEGNGARVSLLKLESYSGSL